jgi:hypothetical protein
MRKVLALAGVSAVALLAPATVDAATKNYGGGFDPSGNLEFKLEKTKHSKKVKGFKFFALPVQCDSGPNTVSGKITFAIKVKRKKFEAVATSDNPDSEAKLSLYGKFTGGGNAKGTLKVKGENVNVDNPVRRGSDTCASPKTNWTASTDN